MDRASKLPKLEDEEKESNYGYVYAVSGPGMIISIYDCLYCLLRFSKILTISSSNLPCCVTEE
jgi:hypothetical protein